jgi:DNA-directed RNA polymerase subunit M/transcription elongation factor TFIIS
MGDLGFLGFQCLNFQCTTFISILERDFSADFSIVCPDCGYVMEDGSSTKFYDYELVEQNPETRDVVHVIEAGTFEVDHRLYIETSLRYKYCIVCNTLKPLDAFGKHSARATGRQGECTICKNLYNIIKNPTRVPDQHREASQKRRLYVEVAGASEKIDTREIFRRFEGKCFKCDEILIDEGNHPIPGTYQLDHTLPAYYLWPMTTDNATLLCRTHNNEKSGSWPSTFYSDAELRTLSAKTGIPYSVLTGAPEINPDALAYLSDPTNVLDVISKYAPYMNEVIKLRNRVLMTAGLDFFQSASDQIAQQWIDAADAELNR